MAEAVHRKEEATPSSGGGGQDRGVTVVPPTLEKQRTGVVFRPLAIASLLLLIGAWQLTSIILGTSPTGYKTVPGIQDVLGSYKAFAGHWRGGLGAADTQTGAAPTYWGATLGLVYHTGVSALRVMVGFLVGLAAGVGLAVVISWSRLAREMFLFPAHFARMLPLLGMLPLFALWFGDSEHGTLLFVAFAIGILMFAITINAIGNVPMYYAQFAQSLGASRLRTYLTVIFPAVIPQLRSGILLALPFSWSAVLAAEVLGKTSGLGRILNFALYYAATDVAAFTGLVVIVIAATTYLLANNVLGWLTRWAE